jgi:hypothetical protein
LISKNEALEKKKDIKKKYMKTTNDDNEATIG